MESHLHQSEASILNITYNNVQITDLRKILAKQHCCVVSVLLCVRCGYCYDASEEASDVTATTYDDLEMAIVTTPMLRLTTP